MPEGRIKPRRKLLGAAAGIDTKGACKGNGDEGEDGQRQNENDHVSLRLIRERFARHIPYICSFIFNGLAVDLGK